MDSGVHLGTGTRNPFVFGRVTGWSATPPIFLVDPPNLKLTAQTKDSWDAVRHAHRTGMEHLGDFKFCFQRNALNPTHSTQDNASQK